ncbi:MAG: phenylacetic acid degradation protein PaaN [Alphaproteobacteria bacterium]|nr:phenylacetic acid degradation protein PaaN [Alphaproteobacteria bacterium]
MTDLFALHEARLRAAVEANATRRAFAAFQESPSRKHHPEGARQRGQAAFEARRGQRLGLVAPGSRGWVGGEVSPWTGEPLGITYPSLALEPALAAARAAMPAWIDAGPQARVGVCMEILARLESRLFEATFATQHTTGQGFMMAFAGNGANSLDRGLEALAMAWAVMSGIPERATFTRSFGHGPVTLQKRYRLRPCGVAAVLSCGTYPAWNAYPAVFASLATGNPVVLKPHPACILPMALAVSACQEVLAEAGFDPALVQLAPDTADAPVARELVTHPDVRLVDFTGGQAFGTWIEQNARQARVYTETSGCNAVVLDGADDLDAVLAVVAEGLSLFSAQMCTAAQNLWVPETVRDGGRLVAHEEVVERLVARVDALLAEPAHASAICGCLFADSVARTVEAAAQGEILRRSATIDDPTFPRARTATPLIRALRADARELAQREHFGPVSFVIRAPDREAALAGATADARRFGAIASYAWTTDDAFRDRIEDAFAEAGASVGIDLVGQRPMNFAAAYSDFHVTGLNPAGTATLTDPAFVADRFRVVQSKREVPGEA